MPAVFMKANLLPMKTNSWRSLLRHNFWIAAFSLLAAPVAHAAVGFTSGDLAVVRVGDGSAALSSAGTAVFLEEHTTNGTAVGTAITIPTASLVVSGTATSEGALCLSADGQYLTLAGYGNNALGLTGVASSPSATTPRVIGLINLNKAFTLPVSSSTAFTGNNIRSGVTDTSGNFWSAGALASSGIYYMGSGAPTTIVGGNNRVVQIISGSLYFSTGSGTRGIYMIPGTPITISSSNLLFATGSASSPYDFAINSTLTTVYVADDSSISAGGGIQKWVNSAGTWSLAYTLGTGTGSTVGARGLAVDFSNPASPVIYATTAESTLNRLIKITDTGAGSAATTLATAGANTLYRGVKLVPKTPTPSIVLTVPANTNVTATSSSGAVVTFTNSATGGCSTPTVVANPPSGSTFPIGTTTVTVTASDTCGNSTNKTFTVTVNPPTNAPVNEYFSRQAVLPPLNSTYISPAQWHVLFNNGIVIRDVRHRFFTQNYPLPPLGSSMTETFSSEIDYQLSTDGGSTFHPASGSANVTVQVTHSLDNNGISFFSTEMTQLDLTGTGFLLRESPTLQSTGQTTVRPVAGGYMISSFFDIFTEVSLDGGNTWTPANAPGHMEMRPDPKVVTPAPEPTPLLPPPNDNYVSPAQWHALYAQGIIITNVSHRLFTGSLLPPASGVTNVHTFNSTLNLQVSLDGGNTFQFASVTAPVTITVANASSSSDNALYDTAMTSLTANLPSGAMIRASQTQPSRGVTEVDAQPDGTYQISSFFDIFTELSLDGGNTWSPATNGPVRMQLSQQAPEVATTTPNLPVTSTPYVSPSQWHALYANGIILTNVSHSGFTKTQAPPPSGGTQTETFGSTVSGLISLNGGASFQPFSASAPVSVQVNSRSDLDNGTTRYFDSQMLSLNLSGGTLPGGVMVRQSSTKQSLGRTSVRTDSTGGYHISSFFDIFTEVSLDGGNTWSPSVTAPATMSPGSTTNASAININCPSNITVNATSSSGVSVFYTVTASGGCSTPTVTGNPPSGSTFPVGTTTVFVTASDTCGNSAQCSFTVTVIAPPISLTCPSNITVTATSQSGANVFFSITASGGCSTPNVTATPPSGSTFPIGVTTVYTYASDSCGTTTNCSFTVTVNPPSYPPIVLTCPSNITVTATGTGGAVVFYTASATGGCSPPPTVIANPPSGSSFPVGTTTVFTTASDNCGDSTNCSFTITVVQSNCVVSIFCPSNIVVTSSVPTSVFFTVNASDSCGGTPNVSSTPPSGSTFPIGTTTVSSTASDSHGTSSCSFTVKVVQPTIPPIMLNCSSNLTVTATSSSGANVFYTLTASGGCSTPNVTATPPSGSTFPIGTTTVFVTATDSCGNSTNCSFTVKVNPPVYPPIVLNCSPNLTVNATGSGGVIVFFSVTASGGCSTPNVTATPPSGSQFPVGTTTVTVTAGDTCGNITNCSFTVTVTKPPISLNCSSNITVTATSSSGANVFFSVSASGGCSTPNVTATPPSGSTFPIGTTTVFVTATDGCGSSTNCSFTVKVNPPVYPPIVLNCSSNITVTATSSSGANVFFSVSASGGCSTPNVTATPPSGSTFPVGTTTVIVTASDSCGTSTNCSFTVTVNPPVYPPIVLNCSSNITTTATSSSGAVVFFTVTASGGCSPPPFVTANPPSGSTFPVGTTTVFVTASDSCGNSTNCSFTVTVNPQLPLVNEYFSTTGLLPPPNSVYISPSQWHVLFNNGIIISDVRHRFFTQNYPPPTLGKSATETFGSELDFNLSTDNGATFHPATGTANVTVQVTHSQDASGYSYFSTEMLQLDLTGPGFLLRESPTLQSTGQTTIRPVSGGYMISSFFDIFTEVSLDGGSTWVPASDAGHVEMRPDPVQVPGASEPTPLLPAPDDAYVSPAQWHALYAQGIVIQNVSHKLFTGSLLPPAAGVTNTHSFNSVLDLDISTDGGKTFQSVRVTNAPVQVTVANSSASTDNPIYDTEMTSLNLTLPNGVMVRESPSLPSRGMTEIDTQTDGTYKITSFFDIFTELSLDGGNTWSPATNGPVRVQLTPQAPEVPTPNGNLPLTNAPYVSPAQWHAAYANGIYITNVSHSAFTATYPPPVPGGTNTETFNSMVNGKISTDGGHTFAPFSAPAAVTVNVNSHSSLDNNNTRYFDTEMTTLNLSGGNLPGGIMVRESPTKQSLGRTSVRNDASGYHISSFFDIFTEVSLDGGNTWSPATTQPVLMAASTNGPASTPSSNLQISKTASTNLIAVGGSVNFYVALTNIGPTTVSNITVTDLLPPGFVYTGSGSSCGSYNASTGVLTVFTLNPGVGCAISIGAMATNTGTFTNTATITSASPANTNVNNSASAVVTVTLPPADLVVTKAVSTTSGGVYTNSVTVQPGQTIYFQLSIANYGPANANGIIINDPLPPGLTYVSSQQFPYNPSTGVWTIGTLNTNNGIYFMYLQCYATNTGTFTNIATVPVPSGLSDPNLSNNTASASVTVALPQADLVVTKGVGYTNSVTYSNAITQPFGQVIEFQIGIANNGPNPATNVVVNDLLPPGLTLVNKLLGTGTYNTNTGAWSVGTLYINSGTSYMYLDAIATNGGTFTNTATVPVPVGVSDTNLSNNTASAVVTVTPAQADLALTKVVNLIWANTNGQALFTVTVTNNGPNSAANVVVRDPLPAGLSLVNSNMSNGTTFNSGTGTWNIPLLTNGAIANLYLYVTSPTPGTFTNVAYIASSGTADPNLLNNTNSAAVTFIAGAQADLAALLVPITNVVPVGGSILFQCTITNLGPNSPTNVTGKLTWPPGLVISGVFGPFGNGAFDTNTGILTAYGSLVPTTSEPVNILFTVTNAGVFNVTFAVNSSSLPDPNLGNNNASTTVTGLVSYAISGSVRSCSGAALTNLPINLTATGLNTITNTGTNGGFTFNALLPGTYTVTPLSSNYFYSPSNMVVTITNANVNLTNFIASPRFITGTVLQGGTNGQPVAGVTLLLGGALSLTNTTDTNGVYIFTNLNAGTYTVTPQTNGFPGIRFGPTNATVNLGSPTNCPGAANFVTTNVLIVLRALEVIQVVQDWSNSVPLVANKATLVRAHLQLYGTNITPILVNGARLYASKVALGGASDNWPPDNGRITVMTNNCADPSIRSNITMSLNFTVRDGFKTGSDIFRFSWTNGIVVNAEPADVAGDPASNGQVQVTYTVVPPLGVRFIRVALTNGFMTNVVRGVTNIVATTNIPTAGQIDEQKNRLISIYPISQITNLPYGYFSWNPARGAPTNQEGWLLWDLNSARLTSSDTNGVLTNRIWYGVVPQGVRVRGLGYVPGSAAEGCISATPQNYQRNLAGHEIGHALGRPHSVKATFGSDGCGVGWITGHCGECAQPGTPDFPMVDTPMFGFMPTLGPLSDDNQVIWGYDTYQNMVISPYYYYDLMSYCIAGTGGVAGFPAGSLGPWQWNSKFTYTNLYSTIQTRFGAAPPPLAPQGPPEPGPGGSQSYLLVRGQIDGLSGDVTFNPCYPIPNPLPVTSGPFTLVVLDTNALPLYTLPFTPDVLQGEEDEQGDVNTTFDLSVPIIPGAKAIEIYSNNIPVGELVASTYPPYVQVLHPNGGEKYGDSDIPVSWIGSDPDGNPLAYLVQFSPDGGNSWDTLAIDLDSTNMDIPADTLPGTTNGLIRVIASDGFNTYSAQSAGPFTITNHVPSIVILQPSSGALFYGDQTIVLQADAYDLEDGSLDGTNVLWTSSLNGPLGSGATLPLETLNLNEGVHLITATAIANSGLTNSASVQITVLRLAPPQLSIQLTNSSQILVSWPASYTNYILESTTSLLPSNWTTVTNAPVGTNLLQTVNLNLSTTNRFFRLRMP
jgi:uncharacterized repeat protein (TIGR01451 family)